MYVTKALEHLWEMVFCGSGTSEFICVAYGSFHFLFNSVKTFCRANTASEVEGPRDVRDPRPVAAGFDGRVLCGSEAQSQTSLPGLLGMRRRLRLYPRRGAPLPATENRDIWEIYNY